MQGRPILFIVIRRSVLVGVTHVHLVRYFSFLIDKMMRESPITVDQLVIILDAHHFSYQNFTISHFKDLILYLGQALSGTQYCTCVVRQNLILSGVTKVVKAVLDP